MEMNVNRELIKALRLNKSWSQEKLAETAGVSLRTVQRVETDAVASLQSRIAIASALGVEPAELDIDTSSHGQRTDPEEAARSFELLRLAWREYVKPLLRFTALIALWVGMISTAFLILTTLISGLFFWEVTPLTFLQSAGQGLIGALLFLPVFFIFYWLYKIMTKPSTTEPTAHSPAK